MATRCKVSYYVCLESLPGKERECKRDYWRCLEEEGRERASKRGWIPESDEEFLGELTGAGYEFVDILEARKVLEESYLPPWRREAEKLEDFAYDIAYAAIALRKKASECAKNKVPRKDCLLDEWEKKYFERLDEASKNAIGKRCTWLFGEIEPYNLSSALNDLTACYHRLLEEVEKIEKERPIKKEGKCVWVEDKTNPKLVEACKEWNVVTSIFDVEGLYEPQDYIALEWHSEDDIAEVRVGSAAGHRTHIDLREGTLRYYDLDEEVNSTMKKLLEDVSLECVEEPDGVSCRNLTEDKLKDVARVLAAATSMDFRIDNPESYWPKEYLGLSEEEAVKKFLESIL